MKPNQIEQFKNAARELECDDDEAAFDKKLKRVVGMEKLEETGGGGECGAKAHDR